MNFCNCPDCRSDNCPAARDESLIIAFVQGAQWWEWHEDGATMWPSDRDKAEIEAEKRAAMGTLGKVTKPTPP